MRHHLFGVRVAVLAATLVLALAGVAAAASAPTPHDRALVRRLAAQVSTFKTVASSTSDNLALKNCAYLKKHPAQAFAAVFAVLPALVINVVTEYKPQLVKLRNTLTAMHPNSPLFARWLGAELKNFDLLLRFDNGGRPIDLCEAVQVMTSKTTTPAQLHALLGIDPQLVATLFQSSSSGASATLTKLNPKMRAFFVSAGMTVKQAAALTK